MRVIMPRLLFVSLVLLAANINADTHIFGGSVATRWQTVGYHGHDQEPCEPVDLTDPLALYPDCDANDFARGNLDNSIGFRFGFERDLRRVGRGRIHAGAEGTLMYTEYNLSQNDVTIINGAATAGASVPWWRIHAGVKLGAGPFMTTDTEQIGALWFAETSATIPVAGGAGLRIAYRHTTLLNREEIEGTRRSPRVVDTSFMFVASPAPARPLPEASSLWEFAAMTGISVPGAVFGGDGQLRSNEFHKLTAARALPWRGTQLAVSWAGAAHESSKPGVFMGYPGNFRTNVVDAYGLSLRRGRALSDDVTLRYGAGAEVADWEDEFRFLLDESGDTIVGGMEIGASAGIGVRLRAASHFSIEASAEQLYWPGIDIGELRLGVGIIISP